MSLQSLLLSQDLDVVRVLRSTLEKLAIAVEVRPDARAGADLLASEKFDAIIVDCDDLAGGHAVLQILRSTPSNKSSVAFAILNGKRTTTQQAFEMGANFVLQKPLTTLNASRCFHAALKFMLRERRRYFRQPVKTSVCVEVNGKTVAGTSTNVSEGGIALLLQEALPKGAAVRLRFLLPGSDVEIRSEAEVTWADFKGLAGLRFQNIPKTAQTHLENWLDQRMEEQLPGSKDLAAQAN